jgi:hypothetical protein
MNKQQRKPMHDSIYFSPRHFYFMFVEPSKKGQSVIFLGRKDEKYGNLLQSEGHRKKGCPRWVSM